MCVHWIAFTSCKEKPHKICANFPTSRITISRTRVLSTIFPFLTVPHVKHVVDEVIVESQLRFGDWACGAIELRHYHRQTQSFLLVGLRKVLLGYPMSPNFANFQGPGRIGNVGALDQHPFENGHIFGNDRNVWSLGTSSHFLVSFAATSVVVLINLVTLLNRAQKREKVLDAIISFAW